MNLKETGQFLFAMQTMYPTSMSQNEAKSMAQITIWQRQMAGISAQEANDALNAFFGADTKGYPPTAGQLKEIVITQRVNAGGVLAVDDIWKKIDRAYHDSNYHAVEHFEALPDIAKRFVGSVSKLRDWALKSNDYMEGVEKNFRIFFEGQVMSGAVKEQVLLPDNNTVKQIEEE